MSIFTKRGKRIVAGSLAGALALSVTPIMGLVGTASAADALPPVADPIGAGNFCENAPTTEPFTDVSATDPGIDEIICLVATELTKGVTPTTYEPNSSITRRQMALFIKRAADLANELDTGTNIAPLPAYDGAPDFLDIAGESAEAKEAIGQLVQADIVQGTTATTYSPGAPVSRRQMAAFINRLQDFLTGDPFTTTGDFFNDDNGDTGEDNLNAVASVGIFQGDGAGNVDPGGNLTRRQMAFVLLRHLQVNFDAGDIGPAFAPSTNATLANDKVGPQMLQFDYNGATGLKSTTATFTGLTDGTDYHVALFQNVDGTEGEIQTVVNTDGIYTFRDKQDSENAPFDGLADYECTSYNGANIVSINGVSSGNYCEYDVQSEDGQLEVRVENSSYSSDVEWLVVWADSDNDNELDLKADNTPSEAFGAAGPFIWHGGEAPTGNTDLDGEYILWVDPATKSFVSSDTYQYFWDSNDVFNYDESYNITTAEFEAYFNANDYLYSEDVDGNDVPYSRNRALVNQFSLYDEGTNAPSAATAAVGDFDASAVDVSANDVRVTWALDPALGNMEEDDNQYAGYCVYRYDAAAITAGDVDSDCFYWSDNTAKSDAAITNKTVVIEDVPPGNWVFTVSANSSDDYESDESEPSNAVTSVISSVVGAPVTQAVPTGATHTDANSNGIVDNGDTLVFTFNEAMADPAANAQISLNDGADATAGLLINGSNATFTKLASNRIAVIVGAAGPVILNAGTTPGLQYVGLRVSDAGDATTGITDLTEGLQWNITGVAHPAQDLEP